MWIRMAFGWGFGWHSDEIRIRIRMGIRMGIRIVIRMADASRERRPFNVSNNHTDADVDVDVEQMMDPNSSCGRSYQ